jgi:uncharacterized phage protein (TIGR02218 family)
VKRCSAALKTHLAKASQTLAWCLLLQREDDAVYAFTSHDRDIAFNLEAFVTGQGYGAPPGIIGTATQTYLAGGFLPSNVATTAKLNPDNLEVTGILDSSLILEDDLRSGVWDKARFAVFLVNWADLTMGAMIERVGDLGEVRTGSTAFVAEMTGLLRRLQLTIGRITAPLCDADVFDTRCGADPGGSHTDSSGTFAFTVTGTLDSVGADGLTLFDAARTEPGPTGESATISNITNANPGHVTTVPPALGLINYQTVTLAGILGPTALNGVTSIRNVTGDGLSFDLAIDTSDTTAYPPYTGGGEVFTVGASGWFDAGRITMTSGPNNGRSMEVRTYVPGQWTLLLPFPVLCTAGDTYSMTAGCNKELLGDCLNKYENTPRHRGFPWVAGNDKLIQVGRHQ